MARLSDAEITDQIARGLVPATMFADEELFELEKERIFARSWVFLAHESEIPSAGDYVVRRVVDDSFIVTRDEQGEVRVHFNMCLHRGMQLCRAEIGNASHYRCPYHGWSYKNTGDLVGVPFHGEAYGGDAGLRREERALLAPPHVGFYNGLIFVNLDPEAPPLVEYLGAFAYYLDFYTRQSEAGVELHGPQRWRVRSNWKISSENFSGDSYHTPHTHKSVVEIKLFGEPTAHKRKEGVLYFADVGGGTTYKLPPGSLEERLAYVGYPVEMTARMKAVWSPEQLALVGDAGFMLSAANVFPNLAFVHNWPQVDEQATVVPFISLRLWQPVSARETEIYSWFVVDRAAPERFKALSRKAYLMCFGTSGMFEQDDAENWASITQMADGLLAKELKLHSRMGIDREGTALHEQYPGWPGPGRAFQGYGEYGQRSFMRLWANAMFDSAALPLYDPLRENGRANATTNP